MKGLYACPFVDTDILSYKIRKPFRIHESFVRAKREKPGLLFSFLAVTHLVLTIAINIGSIRLCKIFLRVNFPKSFWHYYMPLVIRLMFLFALRPLVIMVLLFSGVTYSEYFLPV